MARRIKLPAGNLPAAVDARLAELGGLPPFEDPAAAQAYLDRIKADPVIAGLPVAARNYVAGMTLEDVDW